MLRLACANICQCRRRCVVDMFTTCGVCSTALTKPRQAMPTRCLSTTDSLQGKRQYMCNNCCKYKDRQNHREPTPKAIANTANMRHLYRRQNGWGHQPAVPAGITITTCPGQPPLPNTSPTSPHETSHPIAKPSPSQQARDTSAPKPVRNATCQVGRLHQAKARSREFYLEPK